MKNYLVCHDEFKFREINGQLYRFIRSRDNNPKTGKKWTSIAAEKVVWYDDPTSPDGEIFHWVRVHQWGIGAYHSEAHCRETWAS